MYTFSQNGIDTSYLKAFKMELEIIALTFLRMSASLNKGVININRNEPKYYQLQI